MIRRLALALGVGLLAPVALGLPVWLNRVIVLAALAYAVYTIARRLAR